MANVGYLFDGKLLPSVESRLRRVRPVKLEKSLLLRAEKPKNPRENRSGLG